MRATKQWRKSKLLVGKVFLKTLLYRFNPATITDIITQLYNPCLPSLSSSLSGPNHRHRPLLSRQIHQGCSWPRVWVCVQQTYIYWIKASNIMYHKSKNPTHSMVFICLHLFCPLQRDSGSQCHLRQYCDHHPLAVWKQGEKRAVAGWTTERRGHQLGLHHYVSAKAGFTCY